MHKQSNGAILPRSHRPKVLRGGMGRVVERGGVWNTAPGPGDRALIVGAGTAYSAAVLANMGVEVTALESDKALAELARGQEIAIVDGPLTAGHPADAPYDCILIDGAVEELPDAIIDQLADGGRLAAALAESGVTRLAVGTRSGSAFGMRSFSDAAVSVLPGFFRASAFTF